MAQLQETSRRKKYALISAFFDTRNPGGGSTLSIAIVTEWLKRGHIVHVLSAKRDLRHLDGLQPFCDSGMLILHELIDEHETYLSHKMSEELRIKARNLFNEICPDEIHIHNFHGFVGALWGAVDVGIPTVYVALDFGMSCISWYLYDGTDQPCDGPEKNKCSRCVQINQKTRLIDFPYHLTWMARRYLGKGAVAGHRQFFDPRRRAYTNSASQYLDYTLPLHEKFTHIIAPSPPMVDMVTRYRKSSHGVHPLLYPVPAVKVSHKDCKSTYSMDSQRPLQFVFLGHSDPIKGWHFFLRVLQDLPDGLKIKVIDAGDNKIYTKSITSKVSRYLVQSKQYPSHEISKLLIQSDAVLVPSLWHENTPLAVLESLANGRAVIASDQAGIRHIVHSGRNGFLLPPQDLKAWVKALTQWGRDVSLIRNLHPNCSYSKTTEKFVDELEGLVGSGL